MLNSIDMPGLYLGCKKAHEHVKRIRPSFIVISDISTFHTRQQQQNTSIPCIYNLYFTVQRDIETRGRQLENVLQQYTNFVKPAFEDFCLPVSAIFMKFINK